MFPSVKALSLVLVGTVLMVMAAPALAASDRHVFLAPHLSAGVYGQLYPQITDHPLWQSALAPEQRQIVRILEDQLSEQQPFYWMRTRLDQRSLQMQVSLRHEIWQGDQLVWQQTLTKTRNLRLLGRDLLGVGQALIPQLNQTPQGSLTQWPGLSPVADKVRQELVADMLFQFQQDYQTMNTNLNKLKQETTP